MFSLLLIAGFRYTPQSEPSYWEKGYPFEKPDPFTKKQKQNLYLMLIMIIIVLLFPVLNVIVPENEAIAFINSKLDVGLVAIVFSVIALFLDLAPQKN